MIWDIRGLLISLISERTMTSHLSIVEGYFHCTRYKVSRQYRRHGQIRLLNQTRPKISLGILQQIKTDQNEVVTSTA